MPGWERLQRNAPVIGDPSHFQNETSGVTPHVDRSSPAWLSCAPLRSLSGSPRPIAGSGPSPLNAVSFLGFMSSKSLSPSSVAIALLCAGALAFACGPRTRSEAASTTTPLATVSSVVQQGTAHGHTAGAPLVARLDVKVEHQEVQFALHVTNQSRKHVELSFPNGQTHEFVVLDSVGRELWRWSASRLFTQGVQNKLL